MRELTPTTYAMDDYDKEGISPARIQQFIRTVAKARTLKSLPALPAHDLKCYCETLINGATITGIIATARCVRGYDLVDNEDDTGQAPAAEALIRKYEVFSKRYLGLELIGQGCDPRGASFKLVVDRSLGDSFGDGTHLCVPEIDAFVTID